MVKAFADVKIPKEEFESRHQKCLEFVEERGLKGLVVLSCASAPENIAYLSNISLVGVDIPSWAGGFGGGGEYAAVVMSLGTEPTVALAHHWFLSMAKSQSFITDVRGKNNDLWSLIVEVMKEEGIDHGKVGVVIDGIPVFQYKQMVNVLPGVEWIDCDDAMLDLKLIKSQNEIAVIESCLDRQGAALGPVVDMVQEGIREWELSLEIKYRLMENGQDYATCLFVQSGPNTEAALTSPQSGQRVVKNGDMVTFSIFSVYQRYTAGLDRATVCGKPDDMQKKLAEIELEGCLRAVSLMEPGRPVNEFMKLVYEDLVVPRLEKAGLTDYTIQRYVGHGVGLSITERPLLARSDDIILKPGMVIDVEPGIYMRGQAMGLRTAQIVAVTEDGHKVLTKLPPRVGAFA